MTRYPSQALRDLARARGWRWCRRTLTFVPKYLRGEETPMFPNSNITKDLAKINDDLVSSLRDRDAVIARLTAEQDAVLAVLVKVCEREHLRYGGPGTAPLVGYPFDDAAQMTAAVIARLTAERDALRAALTSLTFQARQATLVFGRVARVGKVEFPLDETVHNLQGAIDKAALGAAQTVHSVSMNADRAGQTGGTDGTE